MGREMGYSKYLIYLARKKLKKKVREDICVI
jgi:hypothetical protein